jgi:hypothetical protein
LVLLVDRVLAGEHGHSHGHGHDHHHHHDEEAEEKGKIIMPISP